MGSASLLKLENTEQDQKRLDDLLDKFKKGEINKEELSAKILEGSLNISFWDSSTERNPDYPEGNNNSRKAFTFNPFFHIKGAIYQNAIKKAVMAALKFGHKTAFKEYDKDAYKFDDPRLAFILKFVEKYASVNFTDSYPYKYDIVIQATELFLFHLKEDIFWRARVFDMCNKFLSEVAGMQVTLFKLTKDEEMNIETWH